MSLWQLVIKSPKPCILHAKYRSVIDLLSDKYPKYPACPWCAKASKGNYGLYQNATKKLR